MAAIGGGYWRTYRNLLATFILGGLWHGAGWTFIFWGFMHGVALVIHRIWKNLNLKLPKIIAWFITFNFINIAWVFFRAKEWEDAIKVLKGMCGLSGISIGGLTILNGTLIKPFSFLIPADLETKINLLIIVSFLLIILFQDKKNILNIKNKFIFLTMIIIISLIPILNLRRLSEFLYFNF